MGPCEDYTLKGLNSMLKVLGEGDVGAGLSSQSDSTTEKERAEWPRPPRPLEREDAPWGCSSVKKGSRDAVPLAHSSQNKD